ncbi:MAG TPA: 2-hydroxymuconate tautomerase family protein [Candidatus Xenobia bacterium]|jgi:4-oxalocrotonate tautomerase
MPIVQIHLIEGREDKIAELIARTTDAISSVLDLPADRVRVIVTEMPKTHYGIGGKTAKELGK